ncbi:hypothetical protein N431DRAFT_560544 [Stipitochalara longipes BDJ]|nr:hypothetical protein N431DRAFT_560544 [Stipitochalara longipes BDJ]
MRPRSGVKSLKGQMETVFEINSAANVVRERSHDDRNTSRSKKARTDRQKSEKLTRSCAECRRRRIKCDSTDPPCGQCTWYKVPGACYYPTRQKRTVPSQESFLAISTALEKSNKILGVLFPGTPVDTLSSLSREQLVALVSTTRLSDHEHLLVDDSDDPLRSLETSPETDFSWDESTWNQDPSQRISDDVNGLSLTLDRKSSFLGISSITAILRVMMHISPGFRSAVDKFQPSTVENKNVEGCNQISTQKDEVDLINAYFTHIHCITPIVDEEEFRSKYAQGGDQQSPWLGLLNMVLAIGSVSTSEPDETSQKIFYARAYENLGLDSLGNGHLDTIQALGLLGGYFCHYLNQPNMANVILGAALRMALAMGLHREPASRTKELSVLNNWAMHETRRRVWWSLFCLDTWASLTLGRPSLGRWDQDTITVALPSSSDSAGIYLRASVEFCKIGTALQDRFARHPPISCKEILEFDEKITGWWENLPPMLKMCEPCHPAQRMARGLMNARYQNLRLVLHRPRLLTTAMLRKSHSELPTEEQAVLQKCRSIASEIIVDVRKDCFPVQQVVRNSVWFLFNACMVPLLSLFSDPNHEDVKIWRRDVENSLSFCDEMSSWSLVIRRTREAIFAIYEASDRVESTALPSDWAYGSDFAWDSWDATSFWDDEGLQSLPDFNPFEFTGMEFGLNNEIGYSL